MFLRRKFKQLILFGALFTLSLGVQTSNVFASTETESDLEKLYSSESSPEERAEFIKSRLDSGDDNVISTTVNELDLYKSVDKSKGISPNQDGSKVKAYLERIKELSTKDRAELQAMGFSDTRIDAIKSAENTYIFVRLIL